MRSKSGLWFGQSSVFWVFVILRGSVLLIFLSVILAKQLHVLPLNLTHTQLHDEKCVLRFIPQSETEKVKTYNIHCDGNKSTTLFTSCGLRGLACSCFNYARTSKSCFISHACLSVALRAVLTDLPLFLTTAVILFAEEIPSQSKFPLCSTHPPANVSSAATNMASVHTTESANMSSDCGCLPMCMCLCSL